MLNASGVAAVLEQEKGVHPPTPEFAGAGSTVGASPRGLESETSGIRLLALASRCVIEFRPKQASRVAGMDA